MARMTLKNYCIGGIALLGGITSKLYSGPYENMVRGYAWDVIAPIFIYNLHYEDFPDNDLMRGGIIFGGLSAIEVSQYLGLCGTGDSKDFIAYGIGTALAIGINKLTRKFSKLKTIDELVYKNITSAD